MTRYTPLWLQAGQYAGSLDRRLIGALWPASATTGLVVAPQGGNMSLTIQPGAAAVPTQNGTGSTLCVSDAVEVVTCATAPGAGLNRIDVVVCQPRANDIDGGANNDFVFAVITGTAAASPVAPAVPAGQLALVQVSVGALVSSIVAGNLNDIRPGMLPVATPASAFRIRQTASQAQLNGNNNWAGTIIDEDTDLAYNASNGFYTIKRAGLWNFSAGIEWSGNATGVRAVGLLSSNAQFPNVGFGGFDLASSDPSLAARMMCAVCAVRMNRLDTVNVQIYQSSGATLNSGIGHFSGNWTAP